MVGTQSIAVAAASLRKPLPESLAALATCCWAVGVVLYLVIAVMVAIVLLQDPVSAELTPPYWVFMGATAISVLAGALILRLPPAPLDAAVHGVVAGLSVVLWAFLADPAAAGARGVAAPAAPVPAVLRAGDVEHRVPRSACTGSPAGSSALS